MPPNVLGQREAMAETHYNILILENSVTKAAEEIQKKIHIKVIYKIIYEDAMFNIVEH